MKHPSDRFYSDAHRHVVFYRSKSSNNFKLIVLLYFGLTLKQFSQNVYCKALFVFIIENARLLAMSFNSYSQ